MKRIFTLCAFVASACAFVSAQYTTLQPSTMQLIHNWRMERQALKSTNSSDTIQTKAPLVATLIQFEDASQSRQLTDLGIEITADLGKIVVALVPIDRLEEISELPGVVSVDAADKQDLMLDYARPASQVTETQNGFSYDGTTMTLDGSGVVCGMVDVGLEANHLNFKNEDGTSRIQRLWHMTSTNGSSTEYDPSNIANFTTDTQTGTHATHVAGIIGGYCFKKGKYVSASTATTGATVTTTSSGVIPYYGVAKGADLAFSVGELYNANIINGVTNIVNYAESVGKPCVINMSLGSTTGPHDGTDSYSQALSALGERAIICMSSGNDGAANMSIVKSLTTGTPLKTFIADNTANGVVDIWGEDAYVFSVTWGVYNTSTQTLTQIVKVNDTNKVWGTFTPANCDALSGFTGQLYVMSQTPTSNHRFHVYTSISIQPNSTNTNEYLCLVVEGTTGQKAYIYGGTNVTFASRSLAGYTTGSAENSINDAACASNILSVGAYTSRNTWPSLSGSLWRYTATNYTVGGISPFSSYGTSFQGKALPLVTAPGANIISSFSRYYVAQNYTNQTKTDMAAQALVSGVNYDYWGPLQGTSMSCPYVTGTIGLWLQADPSLDFDKVVDVINNTSTFSSISMKPAIRWGAGKINAVEGAKYVLANKSAIGSVWQDDSQRLIVTHTSEGLDIFMADTPQGFTATLYDLQGRSVASTRTLDSQVTLPTESIARGIYLLRIATPQGLHLTQKLTL